MITPPNCLAREFYRTGQVKGLVSIDCGLWWAGLSYFAISSSSWSRWVGVTIVTSLLDHVQVILD